MPKTAIVVGPQDHGRHMSLADFDKCEVKPGYVYELERGVIVVSDVPAFRHLAQVSVIKDQIYAYHLTHRGQIHTIATGSECKLLLWDLESERHPDLTIYKKPPPQTEDTWAEWVPALVIEVVSPSSVERDYEDKRDEYFDFGVKEYWIFDADERKMLVLTRGREKWSERVIVPGKLYRPRCLRGLVFDCAPVFAAADAAESG